MELTLPQINMLIVKKMDAQKDMLITMEFAIIVLKKLLDVPNVFIKCRNTQLMEILHASNVEAINLNYNMTNVNHVKWMVVTYVITMKIIPKKFATNAMRYIILMRKGNANHAKKNLWMKGLAIFAPRMEQNMIMFV